MSIEQPKLPFPIPTELIPKPKPKPNPICPICSKPITPKANSITVNGRTYHKWCRIRGNRAGRSRY